MIKLTKYLKPFTFGLIAAIFLLFAQAAGDLSLPNYMSEIVNVGIQQNGIEHAAPDAISTDGMTMITTFMDEKEKELIQENYTLLSVTEEDAKGIRYDTIYPNAESELYVKKELNNELSLEVDQAFSTAAGTFVNIIQDLSPDFARSDNDEDRMEIPEINLQQIYSMQPKFDNLPEEVFTDAHANALATSPSMLNQSGIRFTKAFYTDLGRDIGSIQSAYIMKISLIMILIAFLAGTATILVSLLAARISTGVARNLREDLFTKIESFSNNEFDQFSTSSLIIRTTNDVTQVQQLLTIGIRMLFYAPIMGVGAVIMAVNKSVSLSWILAIAVIATIGILIIIMAVTLPKSKMIQKLIDKLNLVSRENLSGLMVIRAFSTQDHEKERFVETNEDLTKTSLFVNRVMVLMIPTIHLIMNGLTLLIVWMSATQITESAMQVGDMMAFIQYAMQVMMAIMMLSMMLVMVPRAAISAGRISEVLETEVTIVDPKQPKDFLSSKKGVVEFEDVSFRYHNAEKDALCNISFTAQPGETTAIIGSTGSGKSTIANLALRFYDVSKGKIMVSGIDIRDVTQENLRSKIGYVPQKSALLSGSIDFNLRYGKTEVSDEDVHSAVSIAQATDFIEERPDGLNSLITQGATNVSGGQKQRISIARALAKNPDILIFDDSFSALDFKTDATLRKALKESTEDATVLVITQRVSTIMKAEKIIVLDNGQIVGSGTHEELLRDCQIYYEIASSQLSKEELA